MSASADYYSILGIPYNANSEDIRNAYFVLARKFHPDTNPNITSEEKEYFLSIQQAYEVLSNPKTKASYDETLPPEKRTGPEISFNIKYSRSTIPSLHESQLAYVLMELFCTAELNPDHLPPFHICLVLDRSTSMQGERMDAVKTSAVNLIQNLRAQDILSVVSFSDRADVIIPPTKAASLSRSDARISFLQTGGGTEIFQGLSMGVNQLRQISSSYSRQLILLTDGNTYGDEARCLELAKSASEEDISLNILGFGHEWNDSLMDQLAGFGGGNATFISSTAELDKFIQNKLRSLETIYARNLRFDFTSSPDVELRYVFRLSPDTGPLPISNSLLLGNMTYNNSINLLFEFLIPPCYGRDRISLARGSIHMDLPGKNRPPGNLLIDLARNIAVAPPDENPPGILLEALSKLTLYRMQDKVRVNIQAGEIEKATKTLQHLATHLLSQGNRELAHTVLREAEHVKQSRYFSKDGDKRIKYGTRALLLPSSLEQKI